MLESLAPFTLDSQSLRTNSSSVIVGIKDEIEGHMKELNNGKMREKERRTKWGEVKVLRKEFRAREGGVVKEVLGRAKVVLATTHGAGNRMLMGEKEFDVVIIDEAAQATEPGCWIPIMRGRKLILVRSRFRVVVIGLTIIVGRRSSAAPADDQDAQSEAGEAEISCESAAEEGTKAHEEKGEESR